MKDKNNIEKRLEVLKSFYNKVSDIIDNIPEAIPSKTKEMIKSKILGDKDLKNLMDSIDTHRPPKIFLIGRTGVGKSSLINALCNSYVAQTSDIESCTTTANTYSIKDGDRVLLDILDTRGIAESQSVDDSISAEKLIKQQVKEFAPDVIIMMLNATHRDDIVSDIELVKDVTKEYKKRNNIELPVMVVVNKSDEVAPSRYKEPVNYPKSKIDNINDVIKYYKEIIIKSDLRYDSILAVSSLIDWQTQDGIELDADNIKNLPLYEIENLQIAFDGRYQIDELLEELIKIIPNKDVSTGLLMAARLDEVVKRIANHIIDIMSGVAGVIALTPIPIADIYILLIIQALLVSLIASLSGRELNIESAKEFIFSLGGITAAGLGFRLFAQQAGKAMNIIFPGAGSAVSSTVAISGTKSIGYAAYAYYVEDIDLKEVKTKVNTFSKLLNDKMKQYK